MKIHVAVAFLIVGIVLLIVGTDSWNAIQNAFGRLFSGQFTDHTMWLVVTATVCLVAGLAGCFYGRRV